MIALLSISAFAQKDDDSKAALAVVNKLFDMMAAHDPAGIVALHTADAQLVAVMKNKEGKSAVKTFKAEDFSKNFAVKKAEILEDMYAPKVEISGDFAQVWGRYVFFVGGKISHCGVNAFHLVRTDAGWKIAGAASTMEPQGCTEQEKARKPDSQKVSMMERRVDGQTVISESLPKVKVKIDPSFKYLGRVEMDAMQGKAKAEQFIFGEVKEGKLEKAVVVHFEHALPTNDFTFGYPRLKMVKLGNYEFLNQTWAIKDYQLLKNKEVKALFDSKNLQTEADWLMTRYVRVVDEAKKHELILFYLEAASSVSIPVEDLMEGGKSNDKWQQIAQNLIERSNQAFSIVED